MKTTLREWLESNELHLDQNDMEYVADVLDAEGVIVECDDSATDWEFWCGEGVMIETAPTGTRVVREGRYSVTTKIGYYDLTECADGMSPEDTSLYVSGLDSPVYAVSE